MINALYNHLIDYDAKQNYSIISNIITGNNIIIEFNNYLFQDTFHWNKIISIVNYIIL